MSLAGSIPFAFQALDSHLVLSVAMQVDHVKAERNVLAEVHNPYVVKLFYSFQVLFHCQP